MGKWYVFGSQHAYDNDKSLKYAKKDSDPTGIAEIKKTNQLTH